MLGTAVVAEPSDHTLMEDEEQKKQKLGVTHELSIRIQHCSGTLGICKFVTVVALSRADTSLHSCSLILGQN